MSEAIVLSAAPESAERIRAWLADEGLGCTVASSVEDAMRAVASRDFELAIVNLSGDEGDAVPFARAANRSGAGTILLSSKADADRLAQKLLPEGIAVLERPISHSLFRQALRLMDASRRHVESYRSEVTRLRAQLDETKLIDRAKCVLIQYLGIGESDAHRYIEKQAMDLRLTRSEIAENILKTYES